MNEVSYRREPVRNEAHPLTSLALLAPLAGMILGVATTFLLGIAQAAYGNLVVNLFLLAACIVPLRALHLSPRALGLRLIKPRLRRHALLSLLVLALYVAFYLFVIRLTALRPFTSTILWGLLTTFVVAFAEELYFRGILFGAVQDRFSPRVALVTTAILFGLFHARQGFIAMLARTFSGWLWGSVRYASGMIFLLIFPVHVAFNAVWLLFQGNWSNPPAWAMVALPAVEFLLGLTIVFVSDRFRNSAWEKSR